MKTRATPWPPGAAVVWRSLPQGEVSTVLACRVVRDDPIGVALHQPTGAPVTRRVGQRGGPSGRFLLPGTWSGERIRPTWDRPSTLRLHPVGEAYSVIRTWDEESRRFVGWYVNLERPWRRTAVGFDTRDDVFDVVGSDDLERCSLKDEDELDFAVEIGLLGADEADDVRRVADRAMAAIEGRWWPFTEETWSRLGPSGPEGSVELPDGWERP